MYQIKTKILSNKKIIPGYYKISLDAPEIAREAKPGQFVHIRVKDGYDPLLRRPFSIHKSRDRRIEILYKVVGRGTKFLSEEKRGRRIDILGPLGQGFKKKADFKRTILVAGGIGVAPLYFLAEKLAGNNVLVLLGTETKEKILCLEDFRNLSIKVEIATEDGSQGYKGLVSDLLLHFLQKSPQVNLICACGPIPMLKKIAQLSLRYKIPCRVSLEQMMGCGIGACLGCIIKGQDGYLRVCRDGPVFDAQQILWEDLN